MIVNTYAVLDLLVAVLRLMLAGSAAFISWRYVRRLGRDLPILPQSAPPSDPTPAEPTQPATDTIALKAIDAIWDRRAVWLFSVTVVLLGLTLVSWPLLYLMLQSYVPQWQGVMCMYGVTLIGSRSTDWAGYLPTLLGLLQWLKPLVLLVGGAWLVRYSLSRFSRANNASGRTAIRGTAWLGLTFALLVMVESAAESAYVVIPKKGARLDVGCCVSVNPLTAGLPFWSWLPDDSPSGQGGLSWVPWSFALIHGLLWVGLASLVWRPNRLGSLRSWLVFALAATGLPLALIYLNRFVAPQLLSLPDHRCAFDLMAAMPEVNLGIGLYLLGLLSTAWALVAHADKADKWSPPGSIVARTSRPVERHAVDGAGAALSRPARLLSRQLQGVALFGYTAAAVLFLMEWWLA